MPASSPADDAPQPAGWRPGTFRALRHRNYRLYFLGQIVSLTGSWVQTTALMWLADELTHKSAWAGGVLAAAILPTCLFGAWGGALADRRPRRQLIFCTQSALLVLALALTALVWSGRVEAWHLLVIAGLSGLVNAVDLPARLVFVMDMVGREDLVNAVALNALIFNVARAVGPALSGLLYRFGAWQCFLLNTLSFVAVLAALAFMDVAGTPKPMGSRGGTLRDAFRYLAERPTLAIVMLLTAVMAFFGWPFLSLLPALARSEFQVKESGFLLVSGTGAGALLAALMVATFGPRFRRRVFLTAGVLLTVAALLGLSAARSLPEAAGFCGLIGCGLILFFSNAQAVVQLGAADHNRGLLLGLWSVVLSGAVPLGNLLFGPAADAWGVQRVLLGEGLGCAVAALVVLGLFALWRARAKPLATPPEGR